MIPEHLFVPLVIGSQRPHNHVILPREITDLDDEFYERSGPDSGRDSKGSGDCDDEWKQKFPQVSCWLLERQPPGSISSSSMRILSICRSLVLRTGQQSAAIG